MYPGNLLRGQRALRGGQPIQLQPGQPKWTFNARPTVTLGGPALAPGPSTNLPLYHNAVNTQFAAQPSTVYEVGSNGSQIYAGRSSVT